MEYNQEGKFKMEALTGVHATLNEIPRSFVCAGRREQNTVWSNLKGCLSTLALSVTANIRYVHLHISTFDGAAFCRSP